jgi:hypothetical protein
MGLYPDNRHAHHSIGAARRHDPDYRGISIGLRLAMAAE